MKSDVVCFASKICLSGLIFNSGISSKTYFDQFMKFIGDFLICNKPVMISDNKLQRRPGTRQTELHQIINDCSTGTHNSIVLPYHRLQEQRRR
jgi:hypothetical protein